MPKNHHIIARSGLLRAIVEKIETSYADDISLLICYGSYVTGDYSETSDIDFFFVPRTKRGYALNHQFILNNIGYDLWPVSWERLKNISRLEDQPASILMDGEVLFAASEEDLQKLEELRNHVTQNLNHEMMIRRITTKHIDKAKAIYFDLQGRENTLCRVDAIKIAEELLVAIVTLNSTYVKKGVKRIEKELNRLSQVPDGFLDNYRKLIRTNDKAEVQQIVHKLICETDKTCKARFDHTNEQLDFSDLAGFYEEFKSTYNKLLLACDEKNYENAYYAAFMIDRETQSFLTHYAGPGVFPNLIDEVIKNDYDSIRSHCLEHERQLVQLLNKHQIAISTYSNINEFRESFLEKRIDTTA